MPPKSRGHGGSGDSDQPDGTPARRHGGRPTAAGNMEEFEGTVREVSEAGRSTADGGTGGGSAANGPSTSQTDPLITQGTGQPGGTPDGNPTRFRDKDLDSFKRSIARENEGAAILADTGYQVKQNPTRDEVAQARQDTGDTGNTRSKPDYLVEGRVFDCYSPDTTKDVRGIHWEVEHKVVTKNQTQRMVVNLADWRGDMAALQKQFDDWPIPGLKELKAIKPDGEVVQIPLPPGQ